MVSGVQAAQGAARKVIESTYFGTLTVTEMRKDKDVKSKLTKTEPVVVVKNQPCRLSFETLRSVAQTDTAAAVTQITKLFVSPDVVIRPGSKITVTQDNVTTDYTRSGVPAVYPTHQEIVLELFEEYG
ncbi:MAG: hypothetical protein K2P73_03980 [Lachnospiraceae bacterium]|nr:hypothetical protein [Lachnospiraceae bacterium]